MRSDAMEKNDENVMKLPQISEKELLAMNRLMAEKQYRIKTSSSLFGPDKTDSINAEFVSVTLFDYLGHIQRCVASTKKMLPDDSNIEFHRKWANSDTLGYSLLRITSNLDIRTLSAILVELQKRSRSLTVSDLIPFMRLLFKTLIRVYYLGSPVIGRKYKAAYMQILADLVPSDPDSLRINAATAVEEYSFILNSVVPGLYPLLLRMTSTSYKTFSELFYKNGSSVLFWLGINPNEVLIYREGEKKVESEERSVEEVIETSTVKDEVEETIPPAVKKGLESLERLFPEAGWDVLHTMPDLCPYFQTIFNFQDSFIQLSPENPLQITLILFWILEYLFQGLRQIKFEMLSPVSGREDVENINRILEDWILYYEIIFDKDFSVDFKAFTHQMYTQPDYYKSPYGRKLLSNMYMIIKNVFLPFFDIRLYGSSKPVKDERLPPLFIRVSRLKKMLERYYQAIKAVPAGYELSHDKGVPGVLNPWAQYKFDVANPVSVRLDALCGGKFSRTKTNAVLIEYALDILTVLDWWINDKKSFAYSDTPDYLYRVVEKGSSVPAFGINPRTDIDMIFTKSLKPKGAN